jgi:FemAB-related protein (PEP-CTERM system-associated)
MAGIAVRVANLAAPEELRRLDAFVAGHPNSEPFHRPQWSLAVARGCGQQAHYLIAERPDGTIAGVLPLTAVRSMLFGSALVSCGFGVDGGVLIEDPAAIPLLAAEANSLAVALQCPAIELRGGPLPPGFTVREGQYAGFVRDLPAGDDAILTSIPRKQRAEVRKALDLDMQVSIGRGQTDRRDHFQVYGESVRNLGTPVFPRRLFAAMLDAWGEDADVLTVRKDGVPVASVLSLYFKGTVYPYWGGGTRAARGLRANELMYFALMRHAAARGCTRFDFGRSKIGTGAFSYKKNWGFEPRPLTYGIRVIGDGAPREINPLDPKFSLQIALWQKLPLWLTNRIGPWIARGLG